MMKKRAWVLLLPFLLCGAVFWARDVAWNRVETDFRRDVVSHTSGIGIIVVEVAKSESQDDFVSYWQKTDFIQIMEKIELINAQSHSSMKNPLIKVLFEGGEWHGERWGFSLTLREDRGWINMEGRPNGRWRDYEIAPASCRLLKQRIFALR
jgi:hypothetical protein